MIHQISVCRFPALARQTIKLGVIPCLLALMTFVAPKDAIAAGVIAESNEHISLDVNKGTLIKLDQPVNSVFVADPKIADVQIKSPSLIYVMGKLPGETSLYAVSAGDKVIFSSSVRVTHNLGHVKAALLDISEDSDMNIRDVDGMLVLTGKAKSAEASENARMLAQKLIGPDREVINRLDVQSPTQINLRVRIAEVSRDVSKQLGFNWQGGLMGGVGSIGIQNANSVYNIIPNPATQSLLTGPFAQIPQLDPLLPMSRLKQFNVANDGAGSLFGNITSGNLDINGVIDALETEGFLTVLAEPNLTAMSGATASFLAGGEFPIPVPQDNGRTITIAYKQFGVSLTFTPTVMSDNHINLKVQPEVSQLSSTGAIVLEGFSIPSLTTRRAETTVELASGQSFAVAGLLQNNTSSDLRKFPGLGDLPIIGALFRSDKFRRQETELIIIVTPYIVRPVSGTKIALPTDGFMAPSDAERYLHGKTYHAHPKEMATAPQDTKGDASVAPSGFILN